MRTLVPAALSVLFIATSAAAQSFNIDFGAPGAPTPSATFAGAGLPGHWNSIQAPHTTPSTAPQAFDELLTDINGNATSVGLHQFGGMTHLSGNDPGPSGDHAALMNDGVITYNASLETCLYVNGLQNGLYEVLIYAWRPEQPQMQHKTRLDFVAGSQLSGGAWPSGQLAGTTYTRTLVDVTTGYMGPHCGVAPGADALIGALTCGMQIRRIGPSLGSSYCSATANSTGASALLSAVGSPTIATNEFALEAGNLPTDRFGYFLMSASQGFVPLFGGSQGNLCIGSPLMRFSADVLRTGLEGYVLFQPDLANLPQGTVFQGGDNWNFQLWFRDVNPSNTSNTTNGLSITFL